MRHTKPTVGASEQGKWSAGGVMTPRKQGLKSAREISALMRKLPSQRDVFKIQVKRRHEQEGEANRLPTNATVVPFELRKEVLGGAPLIHLSLDKERRSSTTTLELHRRGDRLE
ncbi:unnamed protein product [Brassica oleracea]